MGGILRLMLVGDVRFLVVRAVDADSQGALGLERELAVEENQKNEKVVRKISSLRSRPAPGLFRPFRRSARAASPVQPADRTLVSDAVAWTSSLR